METNAALQVLSALAQDSRLAIFRLVIQHGPGGLSAGAIAEQLGIPNATLSFHLKELTRAGLLRGRQEGRFIFYAPEIDRMNDLIAFLTKDCCAGQSCGVVVQGPACAPGKPRAARPRGAA
jgi:DNA-binding transcriptional ArsR family regulator